ncbi:MAG: bifunctional 2-C-methyl-D-erythritol 4-phosphate cytidylyltransferase/2-C-methyl-D-erythritol 2,4-cyclodiphosphate synthase [Proteobacteria bacterium]|nr:MAG: bifunctional 2-C-methyl-D-erythritol 4-phosphate cytidylyltransferase/2-C-methyl-D-erythritol 2,4-cyclodiphosphate synthase [Pseudomonadota bacterium]
MPTADRTAVLIVAAGRGTRVGPGAPKQWRDLAGQRVLDRTVEAFRAAGFARILCVLHADEQHLAPNDVTTCAGGDTRAASVRAGLEALAADPPDHVLIHDGARPLVSPKLIAQVMEALAVHDGAAPALPVTDALWRGGAHVTGTQPREGLWRAQTPQGFAFPAILNAHRSHDGDAADDVEIARAAGLTVAITEGSEDNLKLTRAADFPRAARLLETPMTDIRLGNGYDVHRFGDGDHVWLCGIRIPHTRGLQGHSDADVGMHALTDAIYGALAEGDIGRHFPPSDPQWKGAESHIFLAHAAQRIAARGYRLANADVTLICERPKIGPHADAMAQRLAEIMSTDPGRISVKATTSERLGFTGREEGIAAIATCALIGG